MLPRSHTLRSGEFTQIIKEGKNIRSPLFVLKYRKNIKKPQAISRFSVVVSKKVAARAVDRNAVRRRVYGAFEEFYKNIHSGFEGVITVTTPLTDVSYSAILTDLKGMFSHASLI